MKKLISLIQAAWRFLDGKKTVVSSFYWLSVYPCVSIWELSAHSIGYKIFMTIGCLLTGVGLGHKVIKGIVGIGVDTELPDVPAGGGQS